MNTRFTIEEENIVAIYAEDSRETTLENILAAMPYMDEDMRQLAAAAVNKPLTFHLPPHVLRLIAPAPAPCFGTGKEYYRRSF